MPRPVRPLLVALLVALPAAGCGDSPTGPTGGNAPPPTEKQLAKEKVKASK